MWRGYIKTRWRDVDESEESTLPPLMNWRLVSKMKKYMVRGQFMVLFMLGLLLLSDSIISPQYFLDLVASESIFQTCVSLLYINTVFLNAAIFAVVYKDGGD